MKFIDLDKIINLRKELHKFPELSGSEYETAKRIVNFARDYSTDQIIENIGKTGVAVVFNGKEKGPSIMIRADIDAIPIDEINNIVHKSITPGVSHKCGHDGHTAIVAGLIPHFSINRPKNGKLILLFQPAEETGKGSGQILMDEKFKEIVPDHIYGLHNIPGFEKGEIIIKNNYFTCASKGLIIELEGETSHAAEPELGINPALAMTEIIQMLNNIADPLKGKDKINMITLVHAKLGEKSFGISPANALVMATLRSDNNEEMQLIFNNSVKEAKKIASKYELKIKIGVSEEFSASHNDNKAVDIIEKSALNHNLSVNKITDIFPWSEDFGKFTEDHKGALFGIGAGFNHPKLHDHKYDFPDEIIETGILIFKEIITNTLKGSL